MSSPTAHVPAMRLYDQSARRLYLNAAERARFLDAARAAHPHVRSFGLTLLYTGCRISEALALTANDVQFDSKVITVRTLKRRRDDCYRELPIPEELVRAMMAIYIAGHDSGPIWQHQRHPINRSTGYRWIKALMKTAQIQGVQASPKGLRHGYGIHALQSGVPLNMLQKWMGHADMATTAIYANACGVEEQEIAKRMW